MFSIILYFPQLEMLTMCDKFREQFPEQDADWESSLEHIAVGLRYNGTDEDTEARIVRTIRRPPQRYRTSC